MMENKKTILLILIIVSFSIGGIFLYKEFSNSNKTAFVKLEKIFEEYLLTIEVKKEVKKVQLLRKHQLDSLELNLKIIRKNLLAMDKVSNQAQYHFDELVNEYKEKESEINQLNMSLESKYETEIWNRVNSGIEEYGKEKGYQYIFGTKGDGNLMYADDNLDITNEVIVYLNKNYEGK